MENYHVYNLKGDAFFDGFLVERISKMTIEATSLSKAEEHFRKQVQANRPEIGPLEFGPIMSIWME